MPTGTVKWFSDKGFGYIAPDEDEARDLFVHHQGVTGGGFGVSQPRSESEQTQSSTERRKRWRRKV